MQHSAIVLQVNLEALWLGGNKLQAITGLDANFRIRALHVNVSSTLLQSIWENTRPSTTIHTALDSTEQPAEIAGIAASCVPAGRCVILLWGCCNHGAAHAYWAVSFALRAVPSVTQWVVMELFQQYRVVCLQDDQSCKSPPECPLCSSLTPLKSCLCLHGNQAVHAEGRSALLRAHAHIP